MQQMNRADRRRAEKLGGLAFERHGVPASNRDPYVVVSLIKSLSTKVETSRSLGDIGPFIAHLYQCVDSTQGSLASISIACQKGCAHCCKGWVPISAPELLQ